MRFLKIKIWLASISKRTWAYIGIIAGFIAVAVAGLFVWMHLCGYTLASWLEKFWPTVLVVVVALIALIMFLIYLKMKKGKR